MDTQESLPQAVHPTVFAQRNRVTDRQTDRRPGSSIAIVRISCFQCRPKSSLKRTVSDVDCFCADKHTSHETQHLHSASRQRGTCTCSLSSQWFNSSLPSDAVRWRGICYGDVTVCACVSVTLVYCAQTTESIIMRPSPDCSPVILAFPHQLWTR